LFHFLDHEYLLVFVISEIRRPFGLYSLQLLMRKGVGVVEHLHCSEKLKEILVIDPLSFFLSLKQFGHVGYG
jgi:hypothetical protein